MATSLSEINFDRWEHRIPILYRSTRSKGKKVFLSSIMIQMVEYRNPPSPAQLGLLAHWWKRHQEKNSVLSEAARGLLS